MGDDLKKLKNLVMENYKENSKELHGWYDTRGLSQQARDRYYQKNGRIIGEYLGMVVAYRIVLNMITAIEKGELEDD